MQFFQWKAVCGVREPRRYCQQKHRAGKASEAAFPYRTGSPLQDVVRPAHCGDGLGKTQNISSSGVWFSTETMLTTGMPIELSITWPVLLNDSCPMKLMIYGCVVRSNEKGAAVAIERYEFRTQGRAFAQAVQHPVEVRMPS